jgi:hypothetical protein
MPQDYGVARIVLRYLQVMAIFLDTLKSDRDPDYPFYRLYPSEIHQRYWNSTQVAQNYLSARYLMQDCLKEFLPTHTGRIQTTSSASQSTKAWSGTLAIAGHRRLLKEEVGLYEEQRQYQKWDRLALSEMLNGSDAMSDRLRRLRFEITPKGFPILLPPPAKKSDKLFVLFGCSVPMVLRPLDVFNVYGTETFRVVGQAFVHGADRGQAVHPDYVRNEDYLWREPLVHGTDDLPWSERKAEIRKGSLR